MSSSLPDAKGVRDGAGAAGRPSDSAKPDSRSRWTVIAGNKNNDQEPPPPPKGGGAAAADEPPRRLTSDLVLAATAGDTIAIVSLFSLASRYVHATARGLVGAARADVAFDAAQTALMHAFASLDTFDPKKGAFTSWLRRIVQREVWKQLMREKRRRLASIEEMGAQDRAGLFAPGPDPSSSVAYRELLDSLDRHEAGLSPTLRAAFAARRAGLTSADFAKREDISIHAARSRFLRCLPAWRDSA